MRKTLSRLSRTLKSVQVDLAQNLHFWRKQQALTMENLADRANIHRRHYQKIEAGHVNATLETLTRLASGLGLDILDLLKEQRS